MNRAEFKKLARVRLREAQVLLKNRQYSRAYYLCGYAVECALKACIARRTARFEFPDKKRVLDSHSHKLVQLILVAELQVPHSHEIAANPAFRANWLIVKDWDPEIRYMITNKQSAEDIISAVSDPTAGVLQWLQQHW